MHLATHFHQAPAHLRLLIVMRAVAIVAMATVYLCFDCFLDIHVPFAAVGGVLGFYALLDVATLLRLRNPAPIGSREMLGQIVADVAILTALLYLTGGARNPLALYYLLLVLYSATALPPRFVWLLASVSVVCYVALHFFHIALPLADSEVRGRFDYFEHALLYAFIAVLIAWFGIRLSALQQLQRDRRRADAEKDAREHYLVGLAALSAGTAHELSTPLSTISVLVSDLRESESPPADWKESIDVLWNQVQLCKRSLAAMADAASVERLGAVKNVRASEFIGEVASRLRAMRPAVRLELNVRLDEDLVLRSDHTQAQALMNFLNNAADASPGSVELHANQDALNPLKLVIEVLDRGPGIAPELRHKLGKDIVTTKATGHGAGILIAQAAIERLGGSVALSERRSGGTCVRVELPGFRLSGETLGAVMR